MARRSLAFIFAAALSAGLFAQAPATPPAESQARAQDEIIYGHQLMTETERMEHRTRMRSLKTAEERQAFRAEHHKLMQERAKARGMTLPEMPPQHGMGMGMGKDQSMGPGHGQGMGQKRGAGAPQSTPPPSAEGEKPPAPK
jgi:hypothetical protein